MPTSDRLRWLKILLAILPAVIALLQQLDDLLDPSAPCNPP